MDSNSISNGKSGALTLVQPKKEKISVKSQDSQADRDPNGRRDREKSSKKLTEEEEKQALENIRKLPGFVKNNLSVSLENQRILIKDSAGRVVKQFDESELRHYIDVDTETKGQIFRKKA